MAPGFQGEALKPNVPNPMSEAFISRPLCPACGSAGRASFQRPYNEPRFRSALEAFYAAVGKLDYAVLAGDTYSVSQCPGCKTWFQDLIPADSVLGKLYEQWIDPEKARLRFHHRQPPGHFLHLAQEVGVTVNLIGSDAPREALDYGCGWAEWSKMVQAFGYTTWGTELSPTRREFARQQGVRVVGDHELPDDYFSLINIDQVLEHVPFPRECLALLARKLHPHGVLRVAVPHAGKVEAALGNFDREIGRPRLGAVNAIAPLEHLNAFTTQGLLHLAASCGLERVRPSWKSLYESVLVRHGVKATLKGWIRPAYLRSQMTTQLYLRRIESHAQVRP